MHFKLGNIPQIGDTRYIQQFVWFPKIIEMDNEKVLVWLETIQLEQEYKDRSGLSDVNAAWYTTKTRLFVGGEVWV